MNTNDQSPDPRVVRATAIAGLDKGFEELVAETFRAWTKNYEAGSIRTHLELLRNRYLTVRKTVDEVFR